VDLIKRIKDCIDLVNNIAVQQEDHPDWFRVNQRPSVAIDALGVLSHFLDAHAVHCLHQTTIIEEQQNVSNAP